MAHEGEARAVADGSPLLGGRHLREEGHGGGAAHADGQTQADPEGFSCGEMVWGSFPGSGRCLI